MKAKKTPEGTMDPHELVLIQKRTTLRNEDIGKIVGKSTETISAYRTGLLHIPPEIAEKLAKIESTYIRKTKENAQHMETATAAGIRHLMADLYPQWEAEKAEGSIFTNSCFGKY